MAALSQRAVDVGDIFPRRVLAGEKELLHCPVALQEQQAAIGRLAVAPGPARLLVVGVEARRDLIVEDEAGVCLVDAEAEGIGGDDDPRVAAHEGILLCSALRSAELAVVQAGGDLAGDEGGMHGFGCLHCRRVDDAAAGSRLHGGNSHRQLLVFARGLHGAVAQVRPVDAGVDGREAADAELARDVGDDLAAGGRRQRQQRRMAEHGQGSADLEKGRPEVVAPVRDAMRLVDDDQRRRPVGEEGDEVAVGEPLGRREDDRRAAVDDGGFSSCRVLRVDRAVELHGGDAVPAQLVALVLHQGDEGRDDERG